MARFLSFASWAFSRYMILGVGVRDCRVTVFQDCQDARVPCRPWTELAGVTREISPDPVLRSASGAEDG